METEEKDAGNVVKFYEKTFDGFVARLSEHEIATCTKYVLNSTSQDFNDKEVSPTINQRIYWEDDIPYYCFGVKRYDCHQGRDRNLNKKRKYAEERDRKAQDDHCYTKRYKQAQTTKKLDCPATVTVLKRLRMPEFKVSGSLSRHYEKVQQTKKIRRKLEEGQQIGEEVFVFNLPDITIHKNHFIGDCAGVTEPVDKRVREHISNLVSRGERNAVVISKLVQRFVENELQETDKLRRRFYPNMPTIRSIISYAKSKIIKSPIDQENTSIFIQSLNKDDNVFFRPCCYQEDENDFGQTNSKSNLLFVYASQKMKELYKKYGRKSILLDATYRTCKYALPLFFVVVNTNVGYQVVCVIVTQFETKEAISEGLAIFKSWSPDTTPKYAMVDFAAEEISSLEETFPNIRVFICSFHREQAWSRWFARGCNVAVPRKEALALLHKIAYAPSTENLNLAIKEIRSKEFYQETPLKQYFEGTWLRELERWATAFKPMDFHLNTNNGVERLNKELKYTYLEGFKGCSLSELIKVVIADFLPERYRLYVEENLKMDSKHRKYDSSLPLYLNERPKWLVKSIMDKLESIPGSVDKHIEQTTETSFTVTSFTKDKLYTVNFIANSCTSCSCEDFSRERIICKHILAVGRKYPAWDMNQIHDWFFDDPIFKKDYALSKNEQTQEELTEIPVPEVNNISSQQYAVLPLRGSNRRHLINDCNAVLRSIQSTLWNLGEEDLTTLKKELTTTFNCTVSKVFCEKNSGLPVEPVKEGKKKKRFGKLPLRIKRSSKSKRVGMTAEMIKDSVSVLSGFNI